MKGQAFARRLRFALNGIRAAFQRERSFRFHLLAGACLVLIVLVVRPAPIWWAVAALAAGMVLVAELFNTAVEALADHLHPEQHPEIQVVKDVAAGAVLVASVFAVLVAVAFLFGLG